MGFTLDLEVGLFSPKQRLVALAYDLLESEVRAGRQKENLIATIRHLSFTTGLSMKDVTAVLLGLYNMLMAAKELERLEGLTDEQ